MKERYLALWIGSLALLLVLTLSGILLPMAAADTPLVQGDEPPTAFAYLPYVVRQYPQPAPTPTSTLPPAGPLPPLQVAPANGATLDTISPSFTINNSALAQPARADLQYAPAPDFSGVEGFRYGRFQGTSTAPLYWNLSAGTTYYWRVRSSFDGDNWGAWSGVWSFTTASGGTLPGAPDLISPTNGSTAGSLRPTLTWSPVSGATKYAITLDASTYFSALNEFTVYSDLDPSTSYRWSVSARNGYGWGAPSNEWIFTTPSVQSTSGAGGAGATGSFFDLQGGTRIWHTAGD
jgi:hypothetical protein